MRTKQKHRCYACGKPVESFEKVKRYVYFVKVFQCMPECLSMVIGGYYERKLLKEVEKINLFNHHAH